MYLYLLTNTVNGKQYVGITSRTMPQRLAEHAGVAQRGRSTIIAHAIAKHGIENFVMRVLAEVETWEELAAMERQAIQEYQTFMPQGYNMTLGGDGTLAPLGGRMSRVPD